LIAKITAGSIFCFIDPCGYKGISLNLLQVVLESWGCDCVLFFNTSGINRNINRADQAHHMKAIFGSDKLQRVINKIKNEPKKREYIILDEFKKACFKIGARYFLPFQFNKTRSKRISHHLIFFSKHHLGFKIMKEVMAKYSHSEDDIPHYIYIEGWDKAGDYDNLPFTGPMVELKARILSDFKEKKLMVQNIIDIYNKRGLYYTDKNVKDALLNLEQQNKVIIITGKKRRKGMLGNDSIVSFKVDNSNGQ
jgi:hypothetical protein